MIIQGDNMDNFLGDNWDNGDNFFPCGMQVLLFHAAAMLSWLSPKKHPVVFSKPKADNATKPPES